MLRVAMYADDTAPTAGSRAAGDRILIDMETWDELDAATAFHLADCPVVSRLKLLGRR